MTTKIEISAMVRNFVARQPYGKMFATRELLNLGRRGSIDRTLSRMVAEGLLRRLAWGIYIKVRMKTRIPSIAEIAAYKARAFGRKILEAASTTLHKRFGGNAPTKTTYATDGKTSSFMTIHGRVHLKNYAPRKLTLANTIAGKMIRSLWELGFSRVTNTIVKEVRQRTPKCASSIFKSSCGIMPQWMVREFVFPDPSVLYDWEPAPGSEGEEQPRRHRKWDW